MVRWVGGGGRGSEGGCIMEGRSGGVCCRLRLGGGCLFCKMGELGSDRWGAWERARGRVGARGGGRETVGVRPGWGGVWREGPLRVVEKMWVLLKGGGGCSKVAVNLG